MIANLIRIWAWLTEETEPLPNDLPQHTLDNTW